MPNYNNYSNPPTPTAPPLASNATDMDHHHMSQENRDILLALRLQEEENALAAAGAATTTASGLHGNISHNIENNHHRVGVSQPTVVEGFVVQNRSPNTNTSNRNMPTIVQAEMVSAAGGGKNQFMTDEELARKVEREMNDELYARQLQENERRKAGNRVQVHPTTRLSNNTNNIGNSANQQTQPRSRSRRGCSTSRWCTAILMLVIIGGGAVVVLLYGSTIWERLGLGGQLPPFFQWDESDDTSGTAQENFKNWKTNGKDGLTLKIVNAMTSDWDKYLQQAVDDWNQAPALSLTIENASEPDPGCAYIPGKLKACNDDYGNTGWSGLNEAWLDKNGVITASTAKMNESYLRGKQDAEKQYVVCHELGHGYGLPHRDTNVNNIDLGTCLDYTTLYRNNMKPDEVDFMNLEQLYGTLGGTSTKNVAAETPVEGDKKEKGGKKDKGNKKERLLEVSEHSSLRSKKSAQAVSRHSHSYQNGRLLFKSDHKEIYEEKLPDGAKIISTVLLA